jgi:hypothetical protein
MRSLNFFNWLNSSSSTMALRFIQSLTQMSSRKCFWWIKSGQRVRLTLPPSVSRPYTKCGVLDISQPYRPAGPVTGIALLVLLTFLLLLAYFQIRYCPFQNIRRNLHQIIFCHVNSFRSVSLGLSLDTSLSLNQRRSEE